MSRLPRHLEHLKTGFTAEAVSATLLRAFAGRAEADGRPNLAARWRRLAEEKDRLAIEILLAAGRVGDDADNLTAVIGEEQYENEVLYPRLIADLRQLGHGEEAELLERVQARQEEHLGRFVALRRELTSSPGDVTSVAEAGVVSG